MYNDMDIQIHNLEQEAYCSVLRAFQAQADAISWEKEGLITDLRKELRVSDDEHRELLARVNSDDFIKRIRDWRNGEDNPSQSMANGGRKRKITPSLPSSSLDQENTPGQRCKRSKLNHFSDSLGARHIVNPSLSALIHNDSAASNPLIGRRVMTRCSKDNTFNEARIIDYNPSQARHCLIYDDKDPPNQTTDWVALDEIPRENIRWVGENLSELVSNGVGDQRQSAQQIAPSTNVSEDKIPDHIEIFDTGILLKEVEKVLDSSNPDPAKRQKAKRMLSVQEQALVNAISILDRVNDADTDDEQRPSEPEPGQQ